MEGGIQSDVLLKAYVPYLKNSECALRFESGKIPIYQTYLCAGGMNGTRKTDTCQGRQVDLL